MRANQELVKRQQAGSRDENGRVEYDPFAEDERRPASIKDLAIKVSLSVLYGIPHAQQDFRQLLVLRRPKLS